MDLQVVVLVPLGIKGGLDDVCTVTLTATINNDLSKWIWHF